MTKIKFKNTNNKCSANTLSCLFDNSFFADSAKESDKDWGFSRMGASLLVATNEQYDIEVGYADMERGVNFSFKNLQNKLDSKMFFIAFAQVTLAEKPNSSHVVAYCISRDAVRLIDTNNSEIKLLPSDFRMPKAKRIAFVVETIGHQIAAFLKTDFTHIF